MNDVGPYTMIRCDERIVHSDRHFRILLYGAYNAHGLIGSECNGIVILDEDLLHVVLDEHCKEDSGYHGASPRQVAEYERIKGLSATEFVAFVNGHPRLRQPIELKIRAKRRPRLNLKRFIAESRNYRWDEASKSEWMADCERVLRMLAAKMGLNEDQYEIRHNRGGPAVSGDVILHADHLYINFSKSSLGPDYGFYWRTCKGRKDFTGGPNQWTKWEQLNDLDALADRMKQHTQPA